MKLIKRIKDRLTRKHTRIGDAVLSVYNTLPFNNKIKGKMGNTVDFQSGCYIRHCSIEIRGSGNQIIVEPEAHMVQTRVIIHADNSLILLRSGSTLSNCEITLYQGEHERFVFGEKSYATDCLFLAAESTEIHVGRSCHIARGCIFRTCDGHTIFNEEGKRANWSKNISIGNHCWIGHRVVCLKGVKLQEGTIVSACSLLNKTFENPRVVIGGVPARILKENVFWQTELIAMDG